MWLALRSNSGTQACTHDRDEGELGQTPDERSTIILYAYAPVWDGKRARLPLRVPQAKRRSLKCQCMSVRAPP